jgi:hypothetical protein
MEFEEIWQKIKRMNHREREMLASEMQQKGFNVGYIHPHYYFDAKAVHDILFYPPHQQHEIEDKDNKYYQALKEIMEDDRNIHVCFKRSKLFPRFINDNREGKTVKGYIGSRYNGDSVNALYRILPGDSLSGERPRSLFITKSDGSEVVYKMVSCKDNKGYQLMTFQRLDK